MVLAAACWCLTMFDRCFNMGISGQTWGLANGPLVRVSGRQVPPVAFQVANRVVHGRAHFENRKHSTNRFERVHGRSTVECGQLHWCVYVVLETKTVVRARPSFDSFLLSNPRV